MAFIQYKFKNEEHRIKLLPHKSSKSSTLYKQTRPSALQRTKDVARDYKSSYAFELVEAEMESVGQSSAGKLPNNQRQIFDICKKLFTSADTDDLALVMERCKCTETGKQPFV